MDPEDHVCLCFHVTRRKIENFIRVEKPHKVSQISQCGGAGTGCGWCRPYLERLFEKQTATRDARPDEEKSSSLTPGDLDALTPAQYAAQRQIYRRKKQPDQEDG